MLSANNVKDKPWKIFNADETGVNTEHSPPKIICKDTVPHIITSSRSATVSVIGTGYALGQNIPPCYTCISWQGFNGRTFSASGTQ